MRADVDDRIHSLESEIERLSHALDDVQARLVRLERGSSESETTARGPARPAEPREAAVVAAPAPGGWEIAPNVAAAGRLLLVLGGAYLLRALTESGFLPEVIGVTAGLVYAFFWLGMASRAGASGQALQAGFHAASALVVAYPLLWETTARRELLSPPWSALLVVLVATTGLWVGVSHRLRATAWLAVSAASVVTLALMVGTRDLSSFALASVAVATATFALTERASMPYLAWLAAITSDLCVGVYTLGRMLERDGAGADTGAGLAAQVALVATALYFFASPVIAGRRRPSFLAVAQTVLAIAVGYAGILFTASAAPSLSVAALGIALGVALSVTAGRRSLTTSSSAYLVGIAVALVFLALLRLVPDPTLAFVLAGLGVVLTVLGRRKGDVLLPLYGAFFFLSAAMVSGTVLQSLYALAAPGETPWPSLGWSAIVILIASTAGYVSLAAPSQPLWVSRARVAAFVDLGLVVLGAGGVIVSTVVGLLGPLEPGTLAVVRTAVLAGAAVLLGIGGTRLFPSRPEMLWLQYPILVLGAIKLLVEDVPNGEADRIFISLALYGTALILAARLARR